MFSNEKWRLQKYFMQLATHEWHAIAGFILTKAAFSSFWNRVRAFLKIFFVFSQFFNFDTLLCLHEVFQVKKLSFEELYRRGGGEKHSTICYVCFSYFLVCSYTWKLRRKNVIFLLQLCIGEGGGGK